MALRSTARIGALALAAPLGLTLPERNAPAIADLIGTPIAALPGLLFHDPSIGRAAFGALRFEDMSEEAVTRFVRNREAFTLFGWSPVCGNPVLSRWLGRIRVPTLLLWGDDDRVVPPAVQAGWAERIVDIYEEVGGVEHMLMQSGGLLSFEETSEHMHLLAEEVAPRVENLLKARGRKSRRSVMAC